MSLLFLLALTDEFTQLNTVRSHFPTLLRKRFSTTQACFLQFVPPPPPTPSIHIPPTLSVFRYFLQFFLPSFLFFLVFLSVSCVSFFLSIFLSFQSISLSLSLFLSSSILPLSVLFLKNKHTKIHLYRYLLDYGFVSVIHPSTTRQANIYYRPDQLNTRVNL